jgi:hypothetical protein
MEVGSNYVSLSQTVKNCNFVAKVMKFGFTVVGKK